MANKTTHQHSWRLVTRCLFLKLKPSAKLVLEALAYHYPKVFPSIARIADLAGVSEATAKRALRVLVNKGLIFKRWRDKRTTVYELKVDRIFMQADKREKSLAQNEPVAQFEPDQNDPVAQFEPDQNDPVAQFELDQNDPLTDNIISTTRNNKSTDHASNELDPIDYENEPQELNAGEEIESDDYPDLASSSDLTEDAQSALGPNCASSKPEDGEDKDHSAKADLQKPLNDIAPCQQEPDTTIFRQSAGLLDLSKTSASSRDCIDDIIEDDPVEGTLDNTIETRTCIKCKQTLPASDFPPKKGRPTELSLWCKTCLPAHLYGEPDLEHEPETAVAAPQQPMPAPVSSEPDQQRPAPAPKPEAKPACKYGILEGPECWFIVDKDGNTVARAPTKEQAILTALQMSGTPHDRFLASMSYGFCKVFDTKGGVARTVKTCATVEEAREEAARLNKESQQPRSVKPAA